MTAIRFNPLTYANKLKEAGFTDKQADTIAQLQDDVLGNMDNINVATKKDIYDLKHELIHLEHRLTIKLGSIMLSGIGILGFLLTHFK